jgi:hypothetical protein
MTANYLNLHSEVLEVIASNSLYTFAPNPILAMCTIISGQDSFCDEIFIIDNTLEMRIINLLSQETKVFDTCAELPYGMKPKLTSVIFCG